MTNKHCIILGGGHAAAQLAPNLRQQGWEGEITLISEEAVIPYQRPPLSKGYLSGELSLDNLYIKKQQAYEKANVNLKLGVRADRIDRENKLLHLSNGEKMSYDKLALTVGARVRELPVPGADLNGVFYLRTLDDVDAIKEFTATESKKRAVIIGGGYIGLETAAVLRKIGLDVTILEAMPRLLQRVTTEDISAFYHRIHTEEGVNICCNSAVSSIEGSDSVQKVNCNDGTSFEADLVIVGIGVIPNTELAEEAGLKINNGIEVNECAQTSDPDIFAAGDCTSYFSKLYDRTIRLESVPNAVAQASAAAGMMCGKPKPYDSLPWFWSDQYDLKLQMAGLSQGHDTAVIRGDINNSRDFSVFYLKDEKLLAIDCINRPKDFMIGKKLIMNGTELDPDSLQDESVDLKTLIV
jgi:3-phenylpropionate/trans-cinnamate dioxygenase ferredoxin reductase subunit